MVFLTAKALDSRSKDCGSGGRGDCGSGDGGAIDSRSKDCGNDGGGDRGSGDGGAIDSRPKDCGNDGGGDCGNDRSVDVRGSATPPGPIVVGKITGQYGVKGWLTVHSYTRPAEQILRYRRWLLAGQRDAGDWQPMRVAETKRQARKLIAKLAGVDDRDAGAELAGRWIAVAESQLADLAPGEYYWSDLIGLAVVNQDGVELGVVDHLIETGANDVLVVREPGDENGATKERLLPWSPHAIVAVEAAAGRLRVEWDADFDAA